MNSYFYALWFPQYKEGKPVVQKTKLVEIELQDIPEAQSLKINGEIQQKTLLISLQYKIDNGESKTLVFHESGWNDTGFIIYKLNLNDDENDYLCDSLRKSMPKAIYHYVKGFFHNHQFHSDDDDSLLNTYFSTTPIDLDNKDIMKNILQIYLQSYIDKYAGYVSLSRETLYSVSANIKKGIKLGASKEELEFVIENNQMVLDGESLYCDFLIDSHLQLIPTNQLQRISGLRNELTRYDERMSMIVSSLTSKRSIHLGIIGIWASFIGALVGVIVSLALSFQSSNDLQKGIDSLRDEIHKISLILDNED